MARVHNWQIGREMSYWYPEARPQKQFAAVFDINKCIACQTCTLACKTTWTSGKGQEYMLWNNVETKPYGFYPLAWDVKLLEKLGPQPWNGRHLRGPHDLRGGAEAGERVLGWRPTSSTTPIRTSARTTARGDDRERRRPADAAPTNWFFYLARICNHCTYPGLPRVVPARLDLQAAGGRHRARRSGALPRLPGVRQGLPVQEGLLQPDDRHVGEVHRLLPEDRAGAAAAVLRQLHRQDPLRRLHLDARTTARADNPIDYLVHVRKVALPLFPQFGLEPNVYYIPPIHVPRRFLRQMFGPGRRRRRSRRTAAPGRSRPRRSAALFGSTERIMSVRVQGGDARRLEDKGRRSCACRCRSRRSSARSSSRPRSRASPSPATATTREVTMSDETTITRRDALLAAGTLGAVGAGALGGRGRDRAGIER